MEIVDMKSKHQIWLRMQIPPPLSYRHHCSFLQLKRLKHFAQEESFSHGGRGLAEGVMRLPGGNTIISLRELYLPVF